MGKAILVGCLLVAVSGCTEYLDIRTVPPGARVDINNEFVGITPIEIPVPRSDLSKPRHYRISLDGYETVEGDNGNRTSGGRITGGVFTLGLLFAVKSPRYPSPIAVALVRLKSTEPTSIESRLERLQQLRDKGAISDAEYQQMRQEAIRGGL